MARLGGKVAVITGGAGGIGQAVGQRFAQEGARVLLVDLDAQALEAAVAAIGGERAGYTVADVTRADQVEAYVRTAVERYGRIDVFFNNAGIEGKITSLTEYTEEEFDKVIAVNVRGVWLGLKYVIPQMRDQGGGSIIITSSIAGVIASPGMGAYVTSKHAVVGMMRTAAVENAQTGVRINTVNPGPIETRMMRAVEQGAAPEAAAQAKAQFESLIPMHRYGTPEEVAEMVLFLASDESRYCTGGVYLIDGGWTAQ